jgi:hypothetical protein
MFPNAPVATPTATPTSSAAPTPASPHPTPTASPTPSPGGSAVIEVSPTAINFGSVKVSSTKNSKVTLTNTANKKGGATVTFNGFSLQQSGKDFNVSTNCIRPLGPKKTCSFMVAFRPRSTGEKSATMFVGSNASNPISFSMSGTGLAPKHKK